MCTEQTLEAYICLSNYKHVLTKEEEMFLGCDGEYGTR